MNGITYLTNERLEKKAVVIDLATIADSPDEVQDLLDRLILEARKDDEMISWEEAKEELRKAGKL